MSEDQWRMYTRHALWCYGTFLALAFTAIFIRVVVWLVELLLWVFPP
jgi:hypothetical protein